MRSATIFSLLASVASAKIYFAGVAESGGEFGVYSAAGIKGTGLPGTFGVDYAFLNSSTVPIWVQQNKINLFRVAFLLERMCPLEFGLGSRFNETYLTEYKAAIKSITSAGAYAILDPHNYMRYNDPSQQPMSGSVIGNKSDPAAASTKQFKQFWKGLASEFKDDEKVIFGIMNEPHDMPTSLILKNDQAAIDGIRASGAKQMILAPGNSYTGGHAFTQESEGYPASSKYLYKLKDPLNNTAIDIHEYLDYDFSGTHIVCNQSFPENMKDVTAWLKQHKLKALVSEIGGDNNTMCANYLKDAVEFMEANTEYIGWSFWAAGPLWGTSSGCCSSGNQWGSIEPGSKALGGGPGQYETVWQATMQKLVPKSLQRSGISSIHAGDD